MKKTTFDLPQMQYYYYYYRLISLLLLLGLITRTTFGYVLPMSSLIPSSCYRSSSSSSSYSSTAMQQYKRHDQQRRIMIQNYHKTPNHFQTLPYKRYQRLRLQMYFDFQDDDPIVIPQENYDALLQSTLPGCNHLSIAKSKIGHGHGLYTTMPLAANSVAFVIPRSKCITLDDVKSHPDLGKVLTIMLEDLGEEEGPIASLSAFLASEMLREQCAEWEEDPSLSGPYADYVHILPTGRAVSEQDHVLWWSDEEVQRLFEGGAAYDKAMALRDWVQTEGGIIEGMLVSDLAQKQMGLSVSQVRRAVTNAFVNVLNRSLMFRGDDGGDNHHQRLVPVLDMCAHANHPNLACEIDDVGNVLVKTTRDIEANEELTIKFYSTDFEGHEWYVMYGFIVPFAEDAS